MDMADTQRVIDALGLVGEDSAQDPPELEPEDVPAAAETAATSEESDADETQSLDEALAELDGQAAPDDEAAPATDVEASADADPYAHLTPEVADLQRQLDAYKAKDAEAESAQADARFLAPWQKQQEINDTFYDAEVARIQRMGEEQGKSQDEIDAAIYRRVELGNGFGIQRLNPQTQQMEFVGRIQADAELQENLRRTAIEYERSKTRPNAFEQMVTKYHLDATDRTALAKFINYPPEHLEEIAKTLGAKNARATSTFAQAKNDAVANVRANLSRQPAPGTPGAAKAKKPYQYTHEPGVRQLETEHFARSIGLIRSPQ
jgi:hypothetical protein